LKPIGTIAIDFHFVGDDSQQFLSKLMEEATDYSCYVESLCEHVIHVHESDDELVLLAIRHSDYLGRKSLTRKIIEKHRIREVVRPYFVISDISKEKDAEQAVYEIKKSIQNCKTGWILYWNLIQLYWFAVTRAIDISTEDEAETQIEEIIQSDKNLRCYTPQFYYLKAQRMRYEGDITKAIELCEKALDLCREFDDKYFESRFLKELGANIGFYSFRPGAIEKAKPLLIEARKICEELGDPSGLMEILSYIGGISGMLGEFNEFKISNLEVLRLRELIKDEPVNEFHNAAVASNQLGEANDALEWAKIAIESARARPLLLPYAHLDMAWALITMNRIVEATHHIDIARKLNLENGLEAALAYEYMVNGLLESARGDYESATHSFENALEINERNSRNNRMIYCLMLLAEVEVASFEPNPANRDDEFSGSWLERFDKFVREMELQGFIGNALYLMGELRLKQGRHDEAQELLQEMLRLSEKPGLAYLREKALQVEGIHSSRTR